MRDVLGDLLVTAGVVVLLFAFYEVVWTNIESHTLQTDAEKQLEEKWTADLELGHSPREAQESYPGEAVPVGEALTRMVFPSLGDEAEFAVVEGTDQDALRIGPGRYVESQLPGEVGNFAVAGHRDGKGAPFQDLDQLETCDDIVIETRTHFLTYKVLPEAGVMASCFAPEQQASIAGDYRHVSGHFVTSPDDIGVIAPVPNADVAPTEKLLTLTTCHPRFSNEQRLIIHAMQVGQELKFQGEDVDISGGR